MNSQDYEKHYQAIKSADLNVLGELKSKAKDDDYKGIRAFCEMYLVREYDDWYWGDPGPNISKAIHEYCRKLINKSSRPLSDARRAASWLAFAYSKLDYDSNDSYLLLEHVVEDLKSDDGRIFPVELKADLQKFLSYWRNDRGIPDNLHVLSKEELEIWQEIGRWEIQPTSMWEPFSERVDKLKERVAEYMPDIGKAVTDAIEGALLGLQDGAEYLTRDKAILSDICERGYEVATLSDLQNVPISVLDAVSANSMKGGKVLAALEGAGAGAGGLFFIAADIPALMLVNMRYMAQVAHTYGFDTESQQERLFLLNLLGAGSADAHAKAVFLNNLNKIAMDVARRKSWKDLNEHAFVAIVRKIAESVGIRLTKSKLSQLVPILGALVGGGANYYYTHCNIDAARMFYRKRWLIRKCQGAV